MYNQEEQECQSERSRAEKGWRQLFQTLGATSFLFVCLDPTFLQNCSCENPMHQ